MRTGIVSGSRSNWYDRSVTPIPAYYNAAVVLTAESLRKTLTVPASKKWRLGGIDLEMVRTTADTTGAGLNYIKVVISDSTPTVLQTIVLNMNDNTLYARVSKAILEDMILDAGSTVKVYVSNLDDFDGATTMYFNAGITEFDA